ncbi:MBL fold metallo-hydrolase [Mesorhizobium sp. M1A.F.Ca.IN.022.07.1.1]|uniref:MBL fold metallo-hydrolase n=1 Tax=unclassified Mesorhizobium TaxID=325217 RepID=UPI000FCCB255|nr:MULTISPECIES: MBL fold metallo-hydrolase [unclassified Mesorhizobium]RUV96604.1 MBL fold metallo-hydrolase [Mesorhizobium sp. M1A.F.Ca.IN.022.07.1.1]RWF99123.1 MAG: MBL fold metallo-hydrolase [Mesorhizobium sp.]RWG95743.1 MAG: MBL fold metallo-hydrolase [Mesorhizobium sp.]RWI93571.1 MAG: MBL fold metallo-hydrolase [Mesorhizobium sp.]TIN45262.1 MAG: MBL fold metallo-hydrolase [Mesorhizobium sp.]
MILRQFLHTDPVAASYLFGCGGKASAAVVDPVGEIAPYIEAARATGMRILYVVDTHIHADHISAGRALAAATGAEYVLFEGAEAGFPFRPVKDGEVLELGNVTATVMHTPGHTPEHLSLLVTDRTRSTEPWFVLTGHTLMVGDLGRTELASSAEDGARALYASVRRLKKLPDHIEVLPGAYSGSVCGRSLSGKPTSTIGFERRFNKAFRIEDVDQFIAAMTADIPPPPPDAARTRAANAGSRS